MNRFLEIKKLSEFKELISQNKLVFVQFTTTMCHPSKMIGPYLEKLTTNYPQVQFAKVYIDKYAEIASAYDVRTTPSYIFFKQGEKLKDVAGIEHQEIESAFANLTSK
ncbi:hypothetical protein G6F57_005395 [Rhizopus arrhizus]|uniref:Thioredoxin n=1 Tax=Rhizopus oryzae TaxID=64495 RepID=A0A9P7BXS1_RHIOR|nr:hypothetical protein G6F23_002263 [Rhizopus arrhizus]KAG1422245.1 hypothetical protein G6F58_003388 [Rhizopus delemar]KAG0768914.1 hypothetical protein G6F24_001520 [Rhizopus arrhizus]KAG0783341.1 hypothetical protein G6F22_008722 [Rhizopus arrhizus]KAG0791351.1 hypothetical protein G6F21_005150 [Rhizopus arrhizus]